MVTAIFLIVSSAVVLLLWAINDIIADWWAFLFIILTSVILVICDTHKNKK